MAAGRARRVDCQMTLSNPAPAFPAPRPGSRLRGRPGGRAAPPRCFPGQNCHCGAEEPNKRHKIIYCHLDLLIFLIVWLPNSGLPAELLLLLLLLLVLLLPLLPLLLLPLLAL